MKVEVGFSEDRFRVKDKIDDEVVCARGWTVL